MSFIYSPQVRGRFEDIDLVLGCGDLPYFYLEYVLTALNVPLFFVRGNHANKVEYGAGGPKQPHMAELTCTGEWSVTREFYWRGSRGLCDTALGLSSIHKKKCGLMY